MSNVAWMRSQLSDVLEGFSFATGKLSPASKISSQLILNHQGMRKWDKNTLVAQLSSIATIITEFASSQLLFSSLAREDQITLLKSNVPLYLQYLIARYFSAATGLDQLSWILEGHISIDSIEEVTSLCRISLGEYNLQVELFPSSDTADLYFHYVQNIGLFYPFPQHCNGLIANLLLYYTTDGMSEWLIEPKRISCIFEQAKDLVKMGFEHLDRTLEMNAVSNIGPLIQSLSQMNQIFGTCQVNSDSCLFNSCLITNSQLTITYTDTEESWLRNQFDLFQSEYQSVDLPKEYLNDLTHLLQTGRPVSETFVSSWMGMMTERIRRVLKIHPEFYNLTDKEQVCILYFFLLLKANLGMTFTPNYPRYNFKN